jgi:hypothetical protein
MLEFMLGIALVALIVALARARADSKYWDDEDIGTTKLPTLPVRTIAHWTRISRQISRQLAADARSRSAPVVSAKPGGPGTPRRR